ncbi:Mdm33 family-domain-containing protein [Dipodascopsis uninucleata]
MDELQLFVLTAGKTLNDLTGYAEIEKLKQSIEKKEQAMIDARKEIKIAKEDYSAAITRRSASQREVNELLQRKHAWGPGDLERFTELYRSDHANEQSELQASERLTRVENRADDIQAELGRLILSRYHEEQIWSDKIRRASTWGTWVLMGVNVVLFMIVQLGLEPWKRKRLVSSFEDKVREMLSNEEPQSSQSSQDDRERLLKSDVSEIAETVEPVETTQLRPKNPGASETEFLAHRPSKSVHHTFSNNFLLEFTILISKLFLGKDLSGNMITFDQIFESTRWDLLVLTTMSASIGALITAILIVVI